MMKHEPIIFTCDYCHKPKKFKSLSSKVINGNPLCKSCVKKMSEGLFY